MVGVFRRSVSFPNKNPNRPSQKPQISHHIRSISLPCRSHPLISQIKDEINGLNSWINSTSKSQPLTTKNLSNGLTLLKQTHETFQDILQLPQTQESLRYHPLWVEKLLEYSLRFVDAYGMFQTSILSLKEEHSSVQIGIRKRDESKLVIYLKAKKILSKEIEKLVSGIRCVNLNVPQQQLHVPVYSCSSTMLSIADSVELGRVIEDVMSLTVSVSVVLFSGVAMSFASKRFSWVKMVRKSGSYKKECEGIEEIQKQLNEVENIGNLKKKGDEEVRSVLKRMRDLEECICGIESVSEKVFRALINSRVLLLNTLTLSQ
ncbi:hypothetical protein L195_g023302 [Trifolium pratense]|uniref:Uncharacterized protein n=2 Tax=Trifolium pratense TaxID=57577 RepID=A0A2K3KYN3_TRIPR|nr:hypothetical protein L195_g027273 [Trifolium pratense]PNX94860.1 hypothetical protein L195_g018041 [Trifolium pratense]PNY00029.1 hypothetical protein L195_g023302 [Trifolium pratense]CAJ2642863.1 unnamed protein product [Trifolium pratense]